jgi:hypothetical protein
MLSSGNLAVLVPDLVNQRHKLVVDNLDDSGLLVRYRCLLGPDIDFLNAFLNGLFRCDVLQTN